MTETVSFEPDEVDFQIVRCLLVGPEDFFHGESVSLDQVGRQLGLHPNTVSSRLRRLKEVRWFLPLSILPNCNRLGFTGGRLFVPMPATRRPRNAVETLFRIEGVYTLVEYLEGWEVILFADDGHALDNKAALVRDLFGATSSEWEVRFDKDWPPGSPFRLSSLDARLLGALAEDARASSTTLAERLGVTPRTIQLHLGTLRREAIFHLYLAGQVATAGMSLAYLCLEFADAHKGKTARSNLKSQMTNCFTQVIVPHKQRYYLWGRSALELAAQAEELHAVDGLTALRFRMLQTYRWNPNYPRWLASRLQALVKQP